MTDRPIGIHRGGPPETVLPEPPAELTAALAAALAETDPDQRRAAVNAVVARVAAVPRRLGPPRRARPGPGRGVRLLPGRLPPRARPAPPGRLARQRLRPLGARDQPGLPAGARRPARARPRRSARPTKRPAAPSSSSSSTRPGPGGTRANLRSTRTSRRTLHEARAHHRHHGAGRPVPQPAPGRAGLPGLRADPGPGEPEGAARRSTRTRASSWSTATCATSRRSSR